jgi:Holliday junction resolvase RusA-like endonuclease
LKEFEAVIFMEPVAKGRAKPTVVGGKPKMYTPAKTVKAESQVIAQIRREIGPRGILFDDKTPLYLGAIFYINKPKSVSKRITMPITRPDIDNYEKLLTDALSGFLYPNDKQIVSSYTRKRYCLDGQVPRIEFKIREESL